MVPQQRELSDAATPQTISRSVGNATRARSRGRVSDRSARRTGLAIPYQAVLERAPDATVITDQEGYITFVNQQTELLFGYTRAQLLGEPVEQLIPARFQAAHRQQRTAYSVTPHTRPMGTELKLWVRRSDGEEFPVEVSLSPLESSGAFFVIATIRDISERQRLETARTNAEAASVELRRLQAITDAALTHPELEELVPELLDRIGATLAVDNVAILLASDDGQMLTLFAAKGPESEVGSQVLVPVGQGVAGSIAATRSPLVIDDLATVKVVNPWLQREVRSLVGVPLIADDQLIGVLHADSASLRRFTADDVRLLRLVGERIAYALAHARLRATEQKARLREEAALEVNQHMEQFLATASHDLRNPVAAALGSIQMAQRRARNLVATPRADAEAIYSGLLGDLERAHHALHRLHRLVGRLFDLTQVQLGQMELKLAPENLSDLVRAAVEAQRAVSPERTIHLQVSEDRPVPVFVDADRIDQVLTNYLANAVKYSPAYKPITVRLEVEGVVASRQARVSVQDHGSGVPAAEQVAIWELYHRVVGVTAEGEQSGSLGLGLYLCKNLVERHGGQVGVNSVPKRGATFWFMLPLTSL